MSKLLPITVIVLAVLSWPCHATELSADLVSRSFMGVITTAKVYLQGENVRIEYGTGMDRKITIYRGDRYMGLWWALDPQKKTYTKSNGRNNRWVTHHISAVEYLRLDNPDVAPMLKKNQVGTVILNGYKCRKFRYNILNKKGQIAAHYTQWRSERLGVPIKLQWKSGNHIWFKELRNIKEIKLPSSLFEVPKNYRKITVVDR